MSILSGKTAQDRLLGLEHDGVRFLVGLHLADQLHDALLRDLQGLSQGGLAVTVVKPPSMLLSRWRHKTAAQSTRGADSIGYHVGKCGERVATGGSRPALVSAAFTATAEKIL